MTKFRKSLLIFGIIVLLIGTALATFIVLSLTGSIKADPIALEFTVDDASKSYDGTPLKGNSYHLSEGALIEGHKPVVSFKGERVEVGNSLCGLDVKIVNENGYDVSNEYKIKVKSGVLSVVPCNIEVTITAQDVVYDGSKIDIGESYTVTNGLLAKGNCITLSIKDEWLENAGNVVAGKTLNAPDINVTVSDANGYDVTHNYGILLSGRFNIVKRPLKISPVSASKDYDGKPLTCSQYNLENGSLVSGHYAAIKFEARDGGIASVTSVGKTLEVIAKAVILDVDGNNVTENYDLTTGVGYLTVNKSNLVVTLKSQEKEYDGNPFAIPDDLTELYSVSSLVGSAQLQFDVKSLETLFSSFKEIGNTTYTVSDFKVLDGTEDITQNFNITVVSGNVKITRRKVSLVAGGTLEKEYDGNFVFSADSGISFNKQLAEGHRFESVTCAPVSTENADIASDAKILSFTLVDAQGNNALGYYEIDNILTFKTRVKITRKPLEVTTHSQTKEYDGQPLSGGQPVHGLLAFGDTFLVSETASIVNAVNVINRPTFAIYNSDGQNVTAFYKLTENYGNLEITKKAITVYLDDCVVEYSKNGITGIALSNYLRCNGASAELFTIANRQYNGIGEFDVDFVWGEDLSVNYEITKGNSKFTIIKKNIYASAKERLGKVYNARSVGELSLTDVVGDIEEIDYNEIQCISSSIENKVDAGVYNAEIVYETRYEKITVTGKFTISPLTVTVSSNGTLTSVYNGLPFQPNIEDLTLTCAIPSTQFAIKNCKVEEKAVNVKFDGEGDTKQEAAYSLKFAYVDLMFSDTGASVNPDNVKVNLQNSKVEVKIIRRKLDISLKPLKGVPGTGADLTGLVVVSNLANGDFVGYTNKFAAVNISGNRTVLNISVVMILRDDVNVTDNYILPESVLGTIIP